MNVLLVLPTQLFRLEYLPDDVQIDLVILWEHPHYFTKYNYNKKKLMLHRASMKSYQNYLQTQGFLKKQITYIDFNKQLSLEKGDKVYMYDTIDKLHIENDIDIYQILSSPNFLLDMDDYKAYQKKTTKFFFNGFYMWSKNRIPDILGSLTDMKSRDKYNRQKMPKDIPIPKLPSYNGSYHKIIKSAGKYIEKHFPNNCGNIDKFIYPIDFETADLWLQDFILNRLENFGAYQDYIYEDEPYLYHSCLSSSINIGLIQPKEILLKLDLNNESVMSMYNINSLEGYIRQLFWREYQRYCYVYADFDSFLPNSTYFKVDDKVNLDISWYNGTTDIQPINDYIHIAFDTGYLHHIVRLMLIGNYMNLLGMHPKKGFKWFMEFAIDSYEWVMYQNVYDMVFFITGGKTMRRPYSSKSNYIANMSTYTKNNKDKKSWNHNWDSTYDAFIQRNLVQLQKFRYYYPKLPKVT